MREPGLSVAIRAVGGVSELARRSGIAQPSISDGDRAPAEAVPVVEAATGMSRHLSRPDPYEDRPIVNDDVDEVTAARAQEYALLAALLARAPDKGLIGRLAQLRGDPTPLGLAHMRLAEAAGSVTVEQVEREYFDLFIGLGRGELLPYASYYLTGFLHERPLARLRGDLAQLGIARAEGTVEPEDHIAILCEIMAGVVGGRFPTPEGTDQQLFEKHLVPWADRFFQDLERAQAANFYARVGEIGRVFLDIEREAFALPM